MIEEDPIEVPIDGTLDLHTFKPKEIKELLVDYIDLCFEKNIYTIRIIHGKGTGALRELVHGQLRKNPKVLRFQLGDKNSGNWGMTIAYLQ